MGDFDGGLKRSLYGVWKTKVHLGWRLRIWLHRRVKMHIAMGVQEGVGAHFALVIANSGIDMGFEHPP